MSQSKAQLLDPQGDLTLPGLLIGVGATFSGNVSIGGTLTKQDVTNIDSVGIITARSGVDITGASAGVNGSSNLILKTGGSERLRITSAGNIGIAETNPSYKLDVNGTLRVTGTSTFGAVSTGALTVTGATNVNSGHVNVDAGYSFQWGDSQERIEQSDGKIEFFCNNGEQMTLSGSNLGIGKTNPAEKLDVVGAIQAGSGGLKLDTHPLVTYASFTDISGGTYAARLGSTGSSTIRSTQIYGGGNHIATFDGVNTRLGISTTAPTAKLEVNGDIKDQYGDVRSIPRELKSTTYTLVASDAGKAIATSAGITVPHNILGTGDAVTIVNNSAADITITQAASLVMYNSNNASTGNRTLAGKGMATVWFSSGAEAYISGSGLS